jgi:hypothetical protein
MSRPRGVRTPTSVPLTGRSASDLLLARDHHCEHGQERATITRKAGEVTTPAGVASAAYTAASSASVVRETRSARQCSPSQSAQERMPVSAGGSTSRRDEAGDASVLEREPRSHCLGSAFPQERSERGDRCPSALRPSWLRRRR